MGVEKAVLLAAGRGSRMREPDPGAALSPSESQVADTGVKAMIPIHGRPFVDYVLFALEEGGIRDVCIVAAPDRRSVLEAAAGIRRRSIRIAFAEQSQPRGTADALLAAEAFVDGQPFLALNSDNYYPVAALRALQGLEGPGLPVFERETLVRQSNIPADRMSRYAILRVGAGGFLEEILEKPDATAMARFPGPVLVSMNLWRFSPLIFEACRRVATSARGERELPLAVQFAISQLHERFRAVPCGEGVLDLSTRADVGPVAQRLRGVARML